MATKRTYPDPGPPGDAFYPGEYIREELEARGWTQIELAERMGWPARLVNDLCQERRGVSAETALDLARALGPLNHG
jgi:HTH-type transcriptional regulator/antitoxin HigA